MTIEEKDKDIHSTEKEEKTHKMANIPEELPILPLRNTVAFPYSVMPLAVGIVGGATRSHPVAQIALKFAAPIRIPLTKQPAHPPDPSS